MSRRSVICLGAKMLRSNAVVVAAGLIIHGDLLRREPRRSFRREWQEYSAVGVLTQAARA
jgi:hypothetical protein